MLGSRRPHLRLARNAAAAAPARPSGLEGFVNHYLPDLVYGANALTRWFFDWYYMRLLIWIAPRRVRWWDEGDFAAAPQEMEVRHVG